MSNSVEVTKTPNRYITVTQKKNVSIVEAPAEQVIEVHDPGVAGPPNVLAVGTVDVGPTPSVTITGVAPNQTINFVLSPGGTYVHNQAVSSNTWVVTHNMGFFPSVSVVDSGGNMVIGDVTYISEDQISIAFSAYFGGKAYLS